MRDCHNTLAIRAKLEIGFAAERIVLIAPHLKKPATKRSQEHDLEKLQLFGSDHASNRRI
jgi:hypothetical protein